MKLLIRQRVFSWSDTYDVYDEAGTPKYYVKAEVFTLGHRIHVYALQLDSAAIAEVDPVVFHL